MALKVITNNKKVKDYCSENEYDFVLMQEDIKEVLFVTRDLLTQGWKLAADPLGGYNFRFNPYHTVILQTSEDSSNLEYDVLRVDSILSKWYKEANDIRNANQKMINDYSDLDYSFATNSLERLLRNPMYYKYG